MLLGLNTCGSTASVALGVVAADKIKILATASLAVRTYSARLIPEIAAMLESRHATLRDIEAIVVVNGPGSFTGIRVGLSTAKGLAEGAGIPADRGVAPGAAGRNQWLTPCARRHRCGPG